jgi:hypothetical protein
MRLLLLIALAGPAAAAGLPPRPQLPALSAKETKKIEEGGVVVQLTLDGKGGGFVTGIVDVAATPERIWQVLLAFERIPESTPSITQVDRYADGPGGNGVRLIDVGYLLEIGWVDVRYHVHHEVHPQEQYLVWCLDPARPNDIVETAGSFSTWPSPTPGKTRFLYQTRVITGRAIPKWVEEDLSQSSLRRYIRFVKAQSEG